MVLPASTAVAACAEWIGIMTEPATAAAVPPDFRKNRRLSFAFSIVSPGLLRTYSD